ncbi:aminoglycoside phosphotransferase family protein [Microbacterium sp. NPDC087591]|uniref:aminoglycoside phosphotransferase family protein n=1 Tax=Microbacterium sp. NPDC087591 TaxID=3364192 RepID=UPI00382FAFA1
MADSPAAEHALADWELRDLLRAAAPRIAALPLTRLADGWDNTIWRLGEDFAVRVPRRAAAAPLIENEQRALPEIAPRLASVGVRVPAPLVCGVPTDRFPWPWSVIPWIEGGSALTTPRRQNASWAPALAAALSALHSPAPADAPHNPVRGVPLQNRDEAMRSRLPASAEAAPLRDAWELGLLAPPSTERVWIHGDLHPGNIIVEGTRLVALIDFGDVTAGDPAYDLAASWMLFDAPGRSAFRAATTDGYDEPTWTRARGWAAYISLMLLTQSDDRPDYRAVGLSTAEELRAAD